VVGSGQAIPNITTTRCVIGSQTAFPLAAIGRPGAGRCTQAPFFIDHASPNGSPRFPGPASGLMPRPPYTNSEESSESHAIAASRRGGGVCAGDFSVHVDFVGSHVHVSSEVPLVVWPPKST